MVDSHVLGNCFHEELQLGRLRSLDILLGQGACRRSTCVNIFHGSDFGMAPSFVVVGADPERATWTRSAPGADTVAVAIEDSGGESFFDRPVVQRIFEGLKRCEVLTFNYGGHVGRGIEERLG